MLEALFWDHNGDFQSATAAAAVALIGAIISAVFSWLSYKNSVKTAERQYIMEQKKIDANLKAKARIEWIIGVRDKTSELVSLLLSLQKEKTVFYEQWLEIEKVSELLKLYFNSKMNKKVNSEIYIEQNKIIISETATSIVLKENNNINKHAYIKKYIE
ncbi:hypothetical protein DBN76_03280, partial [Enterococcus faecalis]|nr:hypothetical protein [Enterococcus faecalis]